MNDQVEKPRIETPEELRKEVIKQRVRHSFQRGVDSIRDGEQYGRQAGLSEAEINELYKEISGEGE